MGNTYGQYFWKWYSEQFKKLAENVIDASIVIKMYMLITDSYMT